MEFTDAEIRALEADIVRLGIFFWADTQPPIRVWLGNGRIDPGKNTIDQPNGAEYRGMGELVNVPAFQELLGTRAERVDFELAGVTQKIMDVAVGEADDVRDRDCALGVAVMDSGWGIVETVRWIRRYTADVLAVDQDSSASGIFRKVILSVASALAGRWRPALAYYVPHEQPADDFYCNLTPNYRQEYIKRWPDL